MNPDAFNESDYLRTQQYANSGNLGARIALHERFSTNTYDLHHWLFDLLLATAPKAARVLEVGSGRGDLWAKNANRIPAGWQVTLSDFSEGMLADARAQIGVASERLRFEVADTQKLPFEDGRFDVVLAHFMLYHVPDRAQAIAELRRVLKPEGVCFAATLGQQHMRELFEAGAKIVPGMELIGQQNTRTFSLENGAEQLAESFAEVQCIDYASDLRVTEIEPIMDYVQSMEIVRVLGKPELIDAFREEISGRIGSEGAFFIRKQSGVFVARGMRN